MFHLVHLSVKLEAWVVGIRLEPDALEPLFYLVIFGDEQLPLTINSQLLFVRNIRDLPKAAELCSFEVLVSADEGINVDLVLDYCTLLYLIANEGDDRANVIVNGLNHLFDMISVTDGVLPDSYRKALCELADHMTFSRSLSAYLNKYNIERVTLIDGVLWGIGWAFSHAKFLL